MSYWESERRKDTLEAFRESYEGSMQCACDHGCNQWLVENQPKVALLLRIMVNPNATTPADYVVQMHTDKATKIWRRLARWETQRFNRLLREGKLK